MIHIRYRWISLTGKQSPPCFLIVIRVGSQTNLSIPSELWPTSERNEDYINSHDRWLIQADKPDNYADFLDIKRGLRMATFVEEFRRDLRKWIDAMRSFLADEAP